MHRRAIGKLQQGMDVGRRLDRNLLAQTRAIADGAFLLGDRGQRPHAFDRAQQVDQVGDIIGAKVQHRAGTGQEKELGVGVPAFHPVVLHGGSARDDGAYAALVQNGPRLLMRAAKKGIRRAADRQALGRRQIAQRNPLFQCQNQRLFGIGVLARLKNALGDLVMGIRDRQVDDDVDVLVGQQIIDRLGPGVEFGRPCRGSLHVDVGHGAHFQPLEQRRKPQIRGRDIAASDDANAKICHVFRPYNAKPAASERVAKRRSSAGLSCSITKCLTPAAFSAA